MTLDGAGRSGRFEWLGFLATVVAFCANEIGVHRPINSSCASTLESEERKTSTPSVLCLPRYVAPEAVRTTE